MSALEPSRLVPRGVVLTLALFILIGLFFSRPTATQFAQHVWIPALAGMKIEIVEKNNETVLGKLVYGLMSAALTAKGLPVDLAQLAKDAKDHKLDQLPDFWMAHTTVYDWKLVTYFRYDEENCYSDYLGVAGTLVNLKDGCDVEPYRTKGGSL